MAPPAWSVPARTTVGVVGLQKKKARKNQNCSTFHVTNFRSYLLKQNTDRIPTKTRPPRTREGQFQVLLDHSHSYFIGLIVLVIKLVLVINLV